MNWEMEYDVIAIFVVTVVFIVYMIRDRLQSRMNQLFFYLIMNVFLTTIFDMIHVSLDFDRNPIPMWIRYAVVVIYYFLASITPVLIYLYVVELVKKSIKNRIHIIFSIIYLLVSAVFVGTSPLTHLIFYFDKGRFQNGTQYILFELLMVGYLSATLLLCFLHRKTLELLKRYSIYFFMSMSILVMILQIFRPQLLLLGFLDSVFIMVMYMTIQDPELYLDKGMECFNQKAFFLILQERLRKKHPGAILFLNYENMSYLNRIMGADTAEQILKNTALFLRKKYGKYQVFHMEDGIFACVFKSEEEAITAGKTIKDWMFMESDRTYLESILPSTYVIPYPKTVSTREEVQDVFQYIALNHSSHEGDQVILFDERIRSEKSRKQEVLEAISRGIQQESFEVYFQPIVITKTKKIGTAEALVRLNDEVLGSISPSEFIIVAEEQGNISKIDIIVLKKVCEFLRATDIKEYGMKYVEMNLSAIDLVERDLAKRIFEIMDSYQIPHNQIVFEITETAYMNEFEIFKNNIYEILKHGSYISMDDYGTGYSNAIHLIQLPYRIVKIDRSLLSESMRNNQAKMVLENTVSLLKRIGREIVVEGVETEAEVELLEQLEVDLLQGFLFSRPIPTDQFLVYLKSQDVETQEVVYEI